MKKLGHFVKIESARSSERLHFDFLSFCFFRNSDGGNVLYFGNPKLLSLLAVISYMLAIEILNFRAKRYFVKFKEHVVGVFILREKSDTLYISSLAVNPFYRKLGIATHILSYSEKLAKQMYKQWLELTVLKMNKPALRLYLKWGFRVKEEKKRHSVLRKNLET
ncbi:GNAT family N-acetyltransferase [Candidatus Bathyarchaeota archaeon]|nr:GNAT family N-acetyltransferase [Candidatus Bathyarchaeota archaeon]